MITREDPTGLRARLREAGFLTDESAAFLDGFQLPRLAEVATRLRGRRVILDIGFLDGLVPFVLKAALGDGVRFVCTERDGRTAECARATAAELGLDVDVVVLDLTDSPLPDELFDAVVLGEVLEHIPAVHLPTILTRLRALLVDGGLVVITTPNLHGLSYRLRHLVGADFQHDPLPDETMGLPHVNLLSARLLTDLGRQAGFDVADVAFHDFTSGPHTMRRSRRGSLQRLRAATLSAWAPASRDDMIVTLRRTDNPSHGSAVFGSTSPSFGGSLRAARAATSRSPVRDQGD